MKEVVIPESDWWKVQDLLFIKGFFIPEVYSISTGMCLPYTVFFSENAAADSFIEIAKALGVEVTVTNWD